MSNLHGWEIDWIYRLSWVVQLISTLQSYVYLLTKRYILFHWFHLMFVCMLITDIAQKWRCNSTVHGNLEPFAIILKVSALDIIFDPLIQYRILSIVKGVCPQLLKYFKLQCQIYKGGGGGFPWRTVSKYLCETY